MKKPVGIFPPMFTVWDKNEAYDQKGQERYMRWLIDNGAQSLVACGSTGENMALMIDEQKKVFEHVVKAVAGEVPVYAGTGKYSTLETLELSKSAKASGGRWSHGAASLLFQALQGSCDEPPSHDFTRKPKCQSCCTITRGLLDTN